PLGGNVVEVSLDEPLAVEPATTYIAQVTVNGSPAGGYAAQANGFASAVTVGDITALADAASGGNGLFNSSSGVTLQFVNTDGSANYWVTPVFVASDPPGLPAGYPNENSTGAEPGKPAYGGSLTITTNGALIEDVTI